MNKSISETIIQQIEDAKPEDGTQRQQLWSCFGTLTDLPKASKWRKPKPAPELWLTLYYSKEEAEADCSTEREIWIWDGKPATMRTLGDAMYEARKHSCAGVIVKAFRDGRWIQVATHPAGVPLPE